MLKFPMPSTSFSTLILLTIFNCCTIRYAGAQHQPWEPMKHRIAADPKTQLLLNVSYVRFKKTEYPYHSDEGSIPGCTTSGVTQEECSNNCFEEPKCIVWSWFIKGENKCRCYSKHPRNLTSTVLENDTPRSTYVVQVKYSNLLPDSFFYNFLQKSLLFFRILFFF